MSSVGVTIIEPGLSRASTKILYSAARLVRVAETATQSFSERKVTATCAF
jgi:hypothetical protein